MDQIQDRRVVAQKPLPTPKDLQSIFSLRDGGSQVLTFRQTIESILKGKSNTFMVIVGPCSIHHAGEALEYANQLASISHRFPNLFIVMRAYFEKPRTTLGWKGMVRDPHLDGSDDISAGLQKAREIIVAIADLGLPVATEVLDSFTIQYLADAVSYAAIGARTVESQPHRELASALSMPVGFKNPISGDIKIAVQAIESARYPHAFIGCNVEGQICQINGQGNPYGHLILRGGQTGTNYDEVSIASAQAMLKQTDLPEALIVDASHGNSGKDPKRQIEVIRSILSQRRSNPAIKGVMVESNLNPGQQSLNLLSAGSLSPGVSITDGCIGWEETIAMLEEVSNSL